MSIRTIQKQIKGVVLAGILAAATLLAGTGCDLENPAAKSVMNAKIYDGSGIGLEGDTKNNFILDCSNGLNVLKQDEW